MPDGLVGVFHKLLIDTQPETGPKTRAGERRMGGLVGEGHILNNSNGVSECIIHPTLKQCTVHMHSLDFICDPVLERAT